ncbi:dioxygenase family protein [Mucilaginibacter lappiensis]|uniref:Protocatechuate 3,4-dioxygenase beta subunit n=1 Tax=Mucilaginibacter lappiensis TaxID=354630 RepID=A0A841JRA7_9SPHI|nr:intradiol ring-cleavage dioxygenase [Mucilaginibacter lappiensis]MBB6130825.1 protocatechuate 3,4-dioxygenase beta subunit [Mucilaginibacter lappiensis]
MDRKKFLKNGLLGLGSIVALPAVVTSCSKGNNGSPNAPVNGGGNNSNDCAVSPAETVGPFPIRTPAQYVRASIIGDRAGIALLMTLTIHDQSNGCMPLSGVWVDVWQCDKDGNYSQYGGNQLQTANYTNQNFLRGRQTTNANGEVSFISIFPGWYPGRAPHIHVEVLTTDGTSLLVTQIAFPVSVYSAVYATGGYNGAPDRSNTQDSIFADSLGGNMADSVAGNIVDGYTLSKTITVR